MGFFSDSYDVPSTGFFLPGSWLTAWNIPWTFMSLGWVHQEPVKNGMARSMESRKDSTRGQTVEFCAGFESRARFAWLQITTILQTDWKSEMHCLKMLTFQDFQDEHMSCALQLPKSRCHNRRWILPDFFLKTKSPKLKPHRYFQDLPPFCWNFPGKTIDMWLGTGTQSLSCGIAVQLCGQSPWLPISEQAEEGALEPWDSWSSQARWLGFWTGFCWRKEEHFMAQNTTKNTSLQKFFSEMW